MNQCTRIISPARAAGATTSFRIFASDFFTSSKLLVDASWRGKMIHWFCASCEKFALLLENSVE